MKKEKMTMHFAEHSLVNMKSFESYLSFVNSIPLLSESEEFNLAEEFRLNENLESARSLVLSHLRLVVSLARNYMGYGLPLADIVQEGSIGLMKAVKRFDARKKVRLVTFAIYWIKAEINEYIIRNWRIVRTVTTKNQRKLFFNLRSHRKDIGKLSETEANSIAQELNVSNKEVFDMNMKLTGLDMTILNSDTEESTNNHAEWLTDENYSPDKMLEDKKRNILYSDGLAQSMKILDDRSKDIIESRWLKDAESQVTLSFLAEKYNISAERVRQLEVKAMQKMKVFLQKNKLRCP